MAAPVAPAAKADSSILPSSPRSSTPERSLITAAENSGRMGMIDRWVLRNTLQALAEQLASGALQAQNLNALYEAARAYVGSGMLAASQDYDAGGMQLPSVVEAAANTHFAKAGIGLGGGALLTAGG